MELRELIVKLTGLKSIAQNKANKLLDNYKSAIPILNKFGFKVGKFKVGMGVIPQVETTVSGSISEIEISAINELIEEHEGNKILVPMLKALLAAKDFKERLGEALPYHGVEINIILGWESLSTFNDL